MAEAPFEEHLLTRYRVPICACMPSDLSDQEQEVFRRAAAAFFFGRESFEILRLQSHPEEWDQHPGGSLLRETCGIQFRSIESGPPVTLSSSWDDVRWSELTDEEFREKSEALLREVESQLVFAGEPRSVLKRRDSNRPTDYGVLWFVRVIANHYESMTGQPPKPPAYDKARQKDRPSEFSSLCDEWAHVLDPNLPSPILSRSGYRKILDG